MSEEDDEEDEEVRTVTNFVSVFVLYNANVET